jgi:3-oxoacyl-[acyl-carrier-protein] synthase-3
MLGIKAIATYIPAARVSNVALLKRFEIDEAFLRDKIGVSERSIKAPDEETSDLALAALQNLFAKASVKATEVEALVVVTQNPDRNIPHVSAVVHGRAGLADSCATFDVSLGCSGYVYGLSILKSFMQDNGMKHGILITADPYSKIIDIEDRNSVLLFGDAATATLVSYDPVWSLDHFTFGSRGQDWRAIYTSDGTFNMDGRAVFNFAASTIPSHVRALLKKVGITAEDIDLYVMHQGSRFIVKTIADRLSLPISKFPIEIDYYGNTVSSSIPLVLGGRLMDPQINSLLICGFGVGLSWASCLCRRNGV